jgi:hypothetical protein
MGTRVILGAIALAAMVAPALAQSPKPDPVAMLKRHGLTTCIASGLGPGPAAEQAAAAAREYLEHGSLPIEAYTEVVKLGQNFLKKDYKNIYGENLLFIKCIDFYHSPELARVVKKYTGKKSQ